MGSFLPKTYLKWREPQIARQTRHALAEADCPRWLRPLMVLVGAGLIMSNWLLAGLDPQKNPPPLMFALLLSFVGSVFFVHVLPAFSRLFSSEIRVTDVAFFISDEGEMKRLDYSKVNGCRIASEVRKEGISVLEITTCRSRTIIVGIDLAVSLDELQRVLTDRGVSVDRVCLPRQESMEDARQEVGQAFQPDGAGESGWKA